MPSSGSAVIQKLEMLESKTKLKVREECCWRRTSITLVELHLCHHCSKTVVVLCSEPIRLDQNESNRVAGNWLTNHVE
jgi:hypothetical protein